jgi:hypothetical protein
LNNGHDRVYGGAHIVGRDLADHSIELCGSWANSEQKGHFDE